MPEICLNKLHNFARGFPPKGCLLAPETRQGQVGGGLYDLVMAQGVRQQSIRVKKASKKTSC